MRGHVLSRHFSGCDVIAVRKRAHFKLVLDTCDSGSTASTEMENEAQTDQDMSSSESVGSEVLQSGDDLIGPISYAKYQELRGRSGNELQRYILQTSSGSSSGEFSEEEARSSTARKRSQKSKIRNPPAKKTKETSAAIEKTPKSRKKTPVPPQKTPKVPKNTPVQPQKTTKASKSTPEPPQKTRTPKASKNKPVPLQKTPEASKNKPVPLQKTPETLETAALPQNTPVTLDTAILPQNTPETLDTAAPFDESPAWEQPDETPRSRNPQVQGVLLQQLIHVDLSA